MKTILFDNDGTLVDTHDLILSSMKHATREVLGHPIPENVLMAKVGQPLAVQVRDFTDDPALQEEWLRVYREHNHAYHDDAIRTFPGVAEGLAQLAAHGARMGVVTSKMHWLAWRGLEVLGLAPYLQCCIGADDCEHHKPHPAPILLGADALGASPCDCIYVGDSPYDLQAGNAAGCETCAVGWGMFSAERLAAENPTFTCESFNELVSIVLG